MQVSLVLSERALHEGQNHLLCDDKISGFRNWLIEAWMSADTGRVKISRFCSTEAYSIPTVLSLDNGNTIINPYDIANTFTNYFTKT